jgi:Ca2+-binding RTX toxin-like protein
VGNVLVDLPLGVATGLSGGISHIENVTGSQGNDLLVGDANPNVLIGGTGRNVLIGGAGADTLNASRSRGDNLLIGGTTNWDTNLAALQAIMAEWDRTDLGFADRRSDLLSGANGQGKTPLNQVNGQLILLTPATNPTSSNGTVHGDASPDTLIGGLGHNWFFYDGDDTLNPKKGDKTNKVT